MSKWIAEFELEDGDTMPEHMDLHYMGANIDFHCRPMWIPVSERLPKGSEIVLLSLPSHIDPNGEECSASVICGHYIGGKNAEWGLSDGDTFGYGIVSVRKGINPIAWMPLPEPYEEESEDKE